MDKFSANNTVEEEEIDLREILFKYLRYWKWFIVSGAVFLFLGVFAYLCIDRKYTVSSAILLKEEKGSMSKGNSPLGGLQELGLLSTTNNIDNEIAVFSSPNLLKQIVASLELHTSYYQKGFFRDAEVYKYCPYYVTLKDISPNDLLGSLNFVISKTNEEYLIEGEYVYLKETTKFEQVISRLPGFVELPNGLGKLYIDLRPNLVLEDNDRNSDYKISINNTQQVAYGLVKDIAIASTTKQSSVLNLNLNVLNVQKGVDVLNELITTYNRNNIQENNEMARNTSDFIDARLLVITQELEVVEKDVVQYKEKEGIADISSEAKLFVEQTSEIEQKRIAIETQLQTVALVERFVTTPENNYKMIPTIGITDLGLAGVITSYNDLLLAYNRIERSASEDSPSRKNAFAELENTREGIKASISNVRNAMNVSKRETERQIASISSKVRSIPTQEKGLLEVMRQQGVKQALYIYLMQVKEETNIAMASTAAKAKMITDPIVPEGPISPKRSIILLATMLLALIVPIAIIFVKDKLEVNITGREDLESLSEATVIGEIMKKGNNEDILVVKQNKTTPIVELFRTLRNNIQFVLNSPEKKVILVTSTIPGEGKTFVSVNLSASFSLSDKKILLIGMDIRNPKLAADMNFSKGSGLTSYLSGSEPNWKSMILRLKDYPNMDILQAGAIPPNPNELLMKPELNQLMDEAREIYDIIIIDSAPIGVVSDTFLISNLADATVYVTREDVTPKGAVNFINTVFREEKLPSMYLVINGVDLEKRKGAYGKYTYGYGKTYGYGES